MNSNAFIKAYTKHSHLNAKVHGTEVSMFMVLWYQCPWYCGINVHGTAVSMFIVLWYQCPWYCSINVHGTVVSMFKVL